MTSGGSESNIAAVLASLTYMREKRGITRPEIIIAETAHASFWKAAKFTRAKYVPRVGVSPFICRPVTLCWAQD